VNDDELLGALGDALAPPDRPVPEAGLAAVRAQAAAAAASPPTGPSGPAGAGAGASRRNVIIGSIAAAVGAAAGIAGTVAATSGGSRDEAAAPPTRPVEFSVVPSGATVAGRTIDHTWGMELLLDVRDLPVDHDYAVTYATADGDVAAGGFRSVAVPMACRFNGTALRAAVTEIAIADQATGEVVLRGRPV
jgi:hypothetical protein